MPKNISVKPDKPLKSMQRHFPDSDDLRVNRSCFLSVEVGEGNSLIVCLFFSPSAQAPHPFEEERLQAD